MCVYEKQRWLLEYAKIQRKRCMNRQQNSTACKLYAARQRSHLNRGSCLQKLIVTLPNNRADFLLVCVYAQYCFARGCFKLIVVNNLSNRKLCGTERHCVSVMLMSWPSASRLIFYTPSTQPPERNRMVQIVSRDNIQIAIILACSVYSRTR